METIVGRRGRQHMRHIGVRELRLQEEVRWGMVVVPKVNGEDNPEDFITKFF